MISMYTDDILLCKLIHHPENYDDLQRDVDAIHKRLSFNTQPLKMQLHQGGGNLISHPLVWSLAMIPWSRLTTTGTWAGVLVKKYPGQTTLNICKTMRLVGMLNGQFYAWADTSTMLRIYRHLHLSTPLILLMVLYISHWGFCTKSFPLLWTSNHVFNYARPFAPTNCMCFRLVPSVVSWWNSLPDHVKASPLSVLSVMYHCYSCSLLSICDIKLISYDNPLHHIAAK